MWILNFTSRESECSKTAAVKPGAPNVISTQPDTSKSAALAAAKADSGVKKIEQAKLAETTADKAADKSLFWFFLISLLPDYWQLSPPVFPHDPDDRDLFMHDTTSKHKARMEAIVYGLSIIVIYMVLGILVAVTLAANFSNFISTHWIPNVFFFVIFMVFAASFLGMFEITLPSWIVNKADKQADKGGSAALFSWPSPWFLFRFPAPAHCWCHSRKVSRGALLMPSLECSVFLWPLPCLSDFLHSFPPGSPDYQSQAVG